MLSGPSHADEFSDAPCRIILKAPIELSKRQDAVGVSGESRVLAEVESVVAAVGIDQPRLIEAEPTHHVTDGVGQ
jgi:hypothetical protein